MSSFLEPFGIKVDVDVVGGEEKPPTVPPTSGEAGPSDAEVSLQAAYYILQPKLDRCFAY